MEAEKGTGFQPESKTEPPQPNDQDGPETPPEEKIISFAAHQERQPPATKAASPVLDPAKEAQKYLEEHGGAPPMIFNESFFRRIGRKFRRLFGRR